ncbi:MAG: PEP-CTERM sorting domain-containing protein [Pirellulales bacterium]|nr:PEP-CTERM sorting domain-containing protein [Pirellulales bacterium]
MFVVALLSGTASIVQAAQIIALHSGDTNPTTEGWTRKPGGVPIVEGPVANDAGFGGLSAWNINDNSTAGGSTLIYTTTTTASQMDNAAEFGWILSMRVRVVDTPDAVDYSVYGGYSTTAAALDRRFLIQLGSDSAGDPIVRLEGLSATTLTGLGNGYHLYELIYDPDAGSADLFVDGVETISNYTGAANPLNFARVGWGGAQSDTIGSGNYNLVSFAILIPEPSTMALLGFGVVGLAVLRPNRSSRRRVS